MAGYRPARGGALKAMENYYGRRRREVEHFGEEAAAAARAAYGRAIRAGEDLDLPTATDVMRYGADLLAGKKSQGISTSRPTSSTGGAKTRKSARGAAPQSENFLDRNPTAKGLAGDVMRNAALVPGVARGAWDTTRDLAGGVLFASRLLDPYDAKYSPRGEAAWDKVFRGLDGLLDGVKSAGANPRSVVNDARDSVGRLSVRVDPRASPVAPTFADEMQRQVALGLNQGEFLFDVGSLIYGGAAAKGLSRASTLGAEKYVARGMPPSLADYFATPYKGRGHHYIPLRTKLPSWLGGGPVPSSISDSPFFLLKPKGITTGDMYELHYNVDPWYKGGSISAEFGGGRWSGSELGWEKYDGLGRVWYGAPLPLKAAAGGGVVGAGALVDQFDGDGAVK